MLIAGLTLPASANDLTVTVGNCAYYGTITHSFFRSEMAATRDELSNRSETIALTYDLGGISPWVGYTRRDEQYYTEIEVTKTRPEIIDGEIIEVPYAVVQTVKRRKEISGVAFGVRGEFWHDRLGLVADVGKYIEGLTVLGHVKYRFHDNYTANIGYLTSRELGFDGVVGGVTVNW